LTPQQGTLEIAAYVAAHSAPVGGGEKRDNHLRCVQRALAVIWAIERPIQFLVVGYDAVLLQVFWRQGLRPGYKLSSGLASSAAFANTVLHGGHLALKPDIVKLT